MHHNKNHFRHGKFLVAILNPRPTTQPWRLCRGFFQTSRPLPAPKPGRPIMGSSPTLSTIPPANLCWNLPRWLPRPCTGPNTWFPQRQAEALPRHWYHLPTAWWQNGVPQKEVLSMKKLGASDCIWSTFQVLMGWIVESYPCTRPNG